MPLLIALYSVLGGTANRPGILMKYLTENDLVGQFYFLVPDIAKTPAGVWSAQGLPEAIPYIILVLLFGLSVWLPQQLMPGERQQKMIGAYMGAIMLFFGWSAPAGVLLYWDVSSIWAVGQQQIMMSYLKRHDAEATGESEPKLKGEGKKSSKQPSDSVKSKKDAAKKKS